MYVNLNANEMIRTREYVRQSALWHKGLSVEWDAIVTPQTRYGLDPELIAGTGLSIPIYNGGVYRNNGEIVQSAIHFSGHHRNIPDAVHSPDVGDCLAGTWIYGGLFRSHFGHFVTECLGRTWGVAETTSDVRGILFLNFNGKHNPANVTEDEARSKFDAPYVREFMRSLRVDTQLRIIVNRGIRCEKLIIPSQLMGHLETEEISGHEWFHSFLKSKTKYVPLSNTRKIYISRSGLNNEAHSFWAEQLFEASLEQHGYTIVHPELLPVEQQISIYSSADQVIVASGSAVHMLALFVRRDARVALISRMPRAPVKFRYQLSHSCSTPPYIIDAINGAYLPANPLKLGYTLASEEITYSVDFDILISKLKEGRFLDERFQFRPDRRRVSANDEYLFALMEQRFKSKVVKQPLR